MHFAFKRWWSAPPPSAQPHPACGLAAAWAGAHGHTFRNVGAEGFVIDGQLVTAGQQGAQAGASEAPPLAAAAPAPWRMEWGPSNRDYIRPKELRIRSEPVLDPELQLLVMNRCLKEQMERSVFELFVEGVQTRIDTATPPEMRWLVLLPTVPAEELPGLGSEWVAVASHKLAMQQWVGTELASALAHVVEEPQKPVVLMISRGQVSLRTELDGEELGALHIWAALFEAALRGSRHLDALATPAEMPIC